MVYPSFRACLPSVASREGGTRNPVSVYLSFRACLPAVLSVVALAKMEASREGGTRNPVLVYPSFPHSSLSFPHSSLSFPHSSLSFPRRNVTPAEAGAGIQFRQRVLYLWPTCDELSRIKAKGMELPRDNINRSRAAQAAESGLNTIRNMHHAIRATSDEYVPTPTVILRALLKPLKIIGCEKYGLIDCFELAVLNTRQMILKSICQNEGVGARTQDLRLKRPLLYQLSYTLKKTKLL